MNYELKTLVNSMYEFGDVLDNNSLGISHIRHDMTMRKILRTELTMFLVYLSGADFSVTWEEADFIRTYLDWNISTSDLKKLWIDQDNDFDSNIPLSLQIAVRADNTIYKASGKLDVSGSQTLINTYETVGKAFLKSDSDFSSSEKRMLRQYLDNLVAYRSRELLMNNSSLRREEDDNVVVTEVAEKSEETAEVESLEELLSQLNSLTGLVDVKNDVTSIINLLRIRRIKEQRGMKQTPMSLHLVFSGNPGTGKTTVARLLAKIYYRLGVLSKGHLVEVDRSGLVGGYVGQTAIKVQEVIQKSIGGVLFIDEAYSLTANKSDNDYGLEAVDTLLKGMEDHRNDLIVIVAGYPDLMNEFLGSNPGLRSRFNKFINFIDYKPDELLSIFVNMCDKAGYTITKDCKEYVAKYFEKRYLTRNANFANARDVRNFFEMAMVNQANRLSTDFNITDDELSEFVLEDVKNIIL